MLDVRVVTHQTSKECVVASENQSEELFEVEEVNQAMTFRSISTYTPQYIPYWREVPEGKFQSHNSQHRTQVSQPKPRPKPPKTEDIVH